MQLPPASRGITRIRQLLTGISCAALITVFGCTPPENQTGPEKAKSEKPDRTALPDERVVTLFGGKDAWAAISSPTKVEAFRLKDKVFVPNDARKPFGGYPVTAGPVDISLEEAEKVVSILSNETIYEWDSTKACEFQPGVAVRFTGAEETVEIVFCFSCEVLAVYRNDERVGSEDFDKARESLAAIVKRWFPDDEAIQSL